MSKTTFSVMVADGRGGSKRETRKSEHPYVACVVLTYGAAYVAWCAEQRIEVEARLAVAVIEFARLSVALGGMSLEVAKATYTAANATFWKLSREEREEAIRAAGGDINVAAGLSANGPCGLCQAAATVSALEKQAAAPLPVAGEQFAVSWHSTRALALKARDEKDARRAGCARAADDSYAVRMDVGAA